MNAIFLKYCNDSSRTVLSSAFFGDYVKGLCECEARTKCQQPKTNNSGRKVPLSAPFCRWGNWGLNRVRNCRSHTTTQRERAGLSCFPLVPPFDWLQFCPHRREISGRWGPGLPSSGTEVTVGGCIQDLEPRGQLGPGLPVPELPFSVSVTLGRSPSFWVLLPVGIIEPPADLMGRL